MLVISSRYSEKKIIHPTVCEIGQMNLNSYLLLFVGVIFRTDLKLFFLITRNRRSSGLKIVGNVLRKRNDPKF